MLTRFARFIMCYDVYTNVKTVNVSSIYGVDVFGVCYNFHVLNVVDVYFVCYCSRRVCYTVCYEFV